MLCDAPRRAFRGTIGLSSGNAGEDAAMNERFYQSFNASPALPLVVGVNWEYQGPPTRRYYFWFFGYVAKLPYERDIQ